MKSNNNKKSCIPVYIPQKTYDNVKKKSYIRGWRYKAGENERRIEDISSGVIKNVKKNRKKENDNSSYREQNIYTDYTAPLGMNGTQYFPKNEFDYEEKDVYKKSLTFSLGNLENEIDNIINQKKHILEMIEKSKPKTIEEYMPKKTKEGEDVKEPIKQAEKNIKQTKKLKKIC